MYVTNDIAVCTCPQTLRHITNPLQLKDKMKDRKLIKESKPDQITFSQSFNYSLFQGSVIFKMWLLKI